VSRLGPNWEDHRQVNVGNGVDQRCAWRESKVGRVGPSKNVAFDVLERHGRAGVSITETRLSTVTLRRWLLTLLSAAGIWSSVEFGGIATVCTMFASLFATRSCFV